MQTEPVYQESELLKQVAEGSEQAFRQLFTTYRDKLYIYILNVTESRETAEDTVHDVFLKIWEMREKLPAIDNFNAYLYRMAHNRAYTGFRRQMKELLIIDELRKEQPGNTSAEGERRIVQKEIREFISQAVSQLTPQQKLVFLMSRQEGLKHEEIAGRLGISIFTVKRHMAEALKFLREEVGNSYGPQAIAIYIIYNLSVG